MAKAKTKRCSRCEKTKPLKDFSQDKSTPDGLSYACRACASEDRKERRRADPVPRLIEVLKARAKKQGQPFDLTVESVRPLYDAAVGQPCPITGKLMLPQGRGRDRFDRRTISIDRIVPAKGYVLDNIAFISFAGNMLKSNFTLEDLVDKKAQLARQEARLRQHEQDLAECEPDYIYFRGTVRMSSTGFGVGSSSRGRSTGNSARGALDNLKRVVKFDRKLLAVARKEWKQLERVYNYLMEHARRRAKRNAAAA